MEKKCDKQSHRKRRRRYNLAYLSSNNYKEMNFDEETKRCMLNTRVVINDNMTL